VARRLAPIADDCFGGPAAHDWASGLAPRRTSAVASGRRLLANASARAVLVERAVPFRPKAGAHVIPDEVGAQLASRAFLACCLPAVSRFLKPAPWSDDQGVIMAFVVDYVDFHGRRPFALLEDVDVILGTAGSDTVSRDVGL
jgi:hypothetical protein